MIRVHEEASDLVEQDTTFHTDFDRALFDKQRIFVGQFVDNPGFTGGGGGFERSVSRVGDHAENSFSVDGQPITDQQSKVFSN